MAGLLAAADWASVSSSVECTPALHRSWLAADAAPLSHPVSQPTQALGPPRKSALERAQEEARLQAAAAAADAENRGVGAPAAASTGAPKTRLQLEKLASTASERAAQLSARLASARSAAAAAERQGSLGAALKPTAPSQMETQAAAWREADA